MNKITIKTKENTLDYDCLCGDEFRDESIIKVINHLENHFKDYLNQKNGKFYI